MAEVLIDFSHVIVCDGVRYHARACGSPLKDGTWRGWLEFRSREDGRLIRTARETTQPNRVATVYWATGLSAIYLEGAFERAMDRVRAPQL